MTFYSLLQLDSTPNWTPTIPPNCCWHATFQNGNSMRTAILHSKDLTPDFIQRTRLLHEAGIEKVIDTIEIIIADDNW